MLSKRPPLRIEYKVKHIIKSCGFDIIGDIHGCAYELESLLSDLGYRETGAAFSNPEGRKAVFLGDYIDRGPEVRRTLQIVRGMIDSGHAYGVLGNHELNALRYHQNGPNGEPLRPHTESKTHQHRATLDQVAKPSPAEWREWLQWFADLPLWLDLSGFRVVHASWFSRDIGLLEGHGPLIDDKLLRISLKGSALETAADRLLCGLELKLPQGESFTTPDGRKRTEIRARWWDDLRSKNCREAVFPDDPRISQASCLVPEDHAPYGKEAPPLFFGHYALMSDSPEPLTHNIACLDFGAGKGGRIGAYRWDGETTIQPDKFHLSPKTNAYYGK